MVAVGLVVGRLFLVAGDQGLPPKVSGPWSPQASEVAAPGSVVPCRVESSWTRERTRVPHVGSQILNPWATRKVPLATADGGLKIRTKVLVQVAGELF